MDKIEFKEIKKYKPNSSDKDINNSFSEERASKNKNYSQIGVFAGGSSYYKYFPFETALKCLKNGTLAFAEPSRWNDAYECLYYEADYSNVAPDYDNHPRVFATCVTNLKYDEAAWRIYSNDDYFCVQFEIDRFKFRHQLLKAVEKEDSIFEGTVQYTTKYYIENIYKKEIENPKTKVKRANSSYKKFIAHKGDSFRLINYLNLLLLKRVDFDHENETRLFIIKNEDLKSEAKKSIEKPVEKTSATRRYTEIQKGELLILNNIEWHDVIKKIVINVKEDGEKYIELKDVVFKMIDDKVKDPNLNKQYKDKLTPRPYHVYGTHPNVIVIEQ